MVERICSHPPCVRPVHAKGLCTGHRAQQVRGKPLGPIRKAVRTTQERFDEKVRKTDGCWWWTGATNQLGYGQLWDSSEGRVVMAHRVSLALVGRPPASDEDVDHLCRHPSCVNPAHLEAVTHAENLARAPYSAVQYQRLKTHCPQGHEYTPENTHHKINSSGTLSRQCKVCRTDAARRSRERKHAARSA